MINPITFRALLLAPASVDMHNPSWMNQQTKAQRVRLAELRVNIIAGINKALTSAQDCCSDHIIAAVMVIASHEYTNGDRGSAFQAHIQGLRVLLGLRAARRDAPPLCDEVAGTINLCKML